MKEKNFIKKVQSTQSAGRRNSRSSVLQVTSVDYDVNAQPISPEELTSLALLLAPDAETSNDD
jgi:hypothetical protein